jgi:hypothetical protein
MRTGGRTDMTKVIVVFRNYANVPKRYFPVGPHPVSGHLNKLLSSYALLARSYE